MKYSAQWTELGPGLKKYVHAWEPTAAPEAVVCIVHGLGEHGGRYAPLAADLVAAGFAVVAFDQTGHGHSPNARGCIVSYAGLMDDIEAVLKWVKQKYANLPCVLLGHSMGGNLVLNYALRKQFLPQAVISSSPMIRAAREPGRLFEGLARMVGLCAPNLRLKSTIDPAELMSDLQEQRALANDVLFHTYLSLRLGAALLDSGRWLLRDAPDLTTPTLLVHGANDRRTCPRASAEYAGRAGERCTFELLEGHYHDSFRDVERAAVIQRFVEFIRAHAR